MQWLWELDQAVFRAIHLGWHRDWLDPVFWLLSTTGLGHVQVPLVVLIFANWRQARERLAEERPTRVKGRLIDVPMLKWRDFSPYVSPALAAFVVSGIFSIVLKQLMARDRPSNFIWAVPQEQFFGDSFPSGHTITSFAIAFALVFVSRSVGRPWIGCMMLIWAGLVGLSRIYRGVHWPTDVVASMMLGLVAACVVELGRKRVLAKRVAG